MITKLAVIPGIRAVGTKTTGRKGLSAALVQTLPVSVSVWLSHSPQSPGSKVLDKLKTEKIQKNLK
jgi:hypothetical protein